MSKVTIEAELVRIFDYGRMLEIDVGWGDPIHVPVTSDIFKANYDVICEYVNKEYESVHKSDEQAIR